MYIRHAAAIFLRSAKCYINKTCILFEDLLLCNIKLYYRNSHLTISFVCHVVINVWRELKRNSILVASKCIILMPSLAKSHLLENLKWGRVLRNIMLSTRTGFLFVEEKRVTEAGSSARQKYVTFYIVMICWTIKYGGCTKCKHLHYTDKHADIIQSPARVWVHTAGREDVRRSGGEDPRTTSHRAAVSSTLCAEKQTAASRSSHVPLR